MAWLDCIYQPALPLQGVAWCRFLCRHGDCLYSEQAKMATSRASKWYATNILLYVIPCIREGDKAG